MRMAGCPVGNGQTQVTVAIANQTETIPVKVQLPAVEPAMSFRHEAMPVLSKAGCNSGGCHGYSLGKNGFKLSLRGSDPEPDYFFITKDSMSRRVKVQSPEQSCSWPRRSAMRRTRGASASLATACRSRFSRHGSSKAQPAIRGQGPGRQRPAGSR